MRATPSLILAGLAALAGPGVAAAADREVEAFSYGYRAEYVKVEPGDTVTWRMGAGRESHTVTTRSRPPRRFDSGVKDTGDTFAFTFSRPGLYQYYCELHTGLMFGAVQVGRDSVRPVISRPRTRVARRGARVFFRLSEGARVQATVTRAGSKVRTLRTGLLRDGGRSLLLRPLGPGRYRVRLVATDRAGNASKVLPARFAVPTA